MQWQGPFPASPRTRALLTVGASEFTEAEKYPTPDCPPGVSLKVRENVYEGKIICSCKIVHIKVNLSFYSVSMSFLTSLHRHNFTVYVYTQCISVYSV